MSETDIDWVNATQVFADSKYEFDDVSDVDDDVSDAAIDTNVEAQISLDEQPSEPAGGCLNLSKGVSTDAAKFYFRRKL